MVIKSLKGSILYMRILLLTNYFPPEIGAAPHLFFDFGGYLVKKGYEVQVLTGLPSYNLREPPKKYKKKLLMEEEMAGMKIIRIGGTHLPFSRKIAILRGAEHFWLSFMFFLGAFFIKKSDLILFYSPPLTLGVTAWLLGKIKGVPFIINVQDLFPQNAIDLGILKNKVLINLFLKIEKFVYEKAAFITVHSPKNKEYIEKRGIKNEKIKVIPNWVDTEKITIGERINDFRKECKLGNKFVVSFAGALGYSQDLDVVLETANLLKENKNILFLIVGEGPEKKRLREKSKKMKLENVKFLPMQPREKYPSILHASDICLVTLRKEVKTPVVPSKILSIMAAGRPIIACLNLGGDAPKVINQARCGYVLPPGDFRGLSNAISKLYRSLESRRELGYNGRRYCEENFSLDTCVKKYIDLFKAVTKK
jgi:glycosyltransferase involved in cell wall biosynthesis